MAVAAVTACSAPGPAKPGAATYYLALGDSLSRGVQPDAAGISVETGKGYPELVYAQLARDHRGLRLVRLGCPGETTMTMIHGGICRYPGGSQLAAAVTFLHAHRGHVLLVTIDIGANDPEACDSQPSLASLVRLASCVGQVPGAAARLGTILASLRAAARPRVRIVGMSYYLPELAECRTRRRRTTRSRARRATMPACGSTGMCRSRWMTASCCALTYSVLRAMPVTR
jgi:lysophospholipase L1-like esterase